MLENPLLLALDA